MARKTGGRRFKKSIAIVGDGYVEHYYFQNMRDYEEDELWWVDVLPKLSEATGSFDKAINKAIELVERGVDQAFAVIDIDKILSDQKQEAFEAKQREINEVNKTNSGKVSLCFCNPCFEYWLLLHYKYTARHFTDCTEVENELADEITGYRKTRKYHSRNDLYVTLRDKLEEAIENGEKSEKAYQKAKSDSHPISTVQKIFFELGIGTDS